MIIYNKQMLDVVIKDIFNKFDEYKELEISYDKPAKDKTKRQLGFWFGALAKAIRDFYKEQGDERTIDEIKENFYCACSYMDERLKKKAKRFNGEIYEIPKRLSEMDRDEASLFIDSSLRLIDKAKCFQGLILHPSIRYTWIKNISTDEIIEANRWEFQREDKEYLKYQRNQACLWCGKQHQTEAHHLRDLGYCGTGYKIGDWGTIPLCHDCHINNLHSKGKESFMESINWITRYLSLDVFCKICYNRYKQKI